MNMNVILIASMMMVSTAADSLLQSALSLKESLSFPEMLEQKFNIVFDKEDLDEMTSVYKFTTTQDMTLAEGFAQVLSDLTGLDFHFPMSVDENVSLTIVENSKGIDFSYIGKLSLGSPKSLDDSGSFPFRGEKINNYSESTNFLTLSILGVSSGPVDLRVGWSHDVDDDWYNEIVIKYHLQTGEEVEIKIQPKLNHDTSEVEFVLFKDENKKGYITVSEDDRISFNIVKNPTISRVIDYLLDFFGKRWYCEECSSVDNLRVVEPLLNWSKVNSFTNMVSFKMKLPAFLSRYRV